ncbi:MAG: uroporphyrinogen decarboxylase/cobalamine-independent methonine synthase family protein [Armatimonadota bacterium]
MDYEFKHDFDEAMARVEAWFVGEIIDRPPIRLSAHNAEFATDRKSRIHSTLRQRWLDVEYQLDEFEETLSRTQFLCESFPVFWPNLGPNVYAALFGCPLEFEETTSWTEPILDDLEGIEELDIDWSHEYLRKLDEFTAAALGRAKGRYLVGYTDLHPGADCAAALRGTENLCMDIVENPDRVKSLIEKCSRPFQALYDHINDRICATGQHSITWMGIPAPGKFHIPSNDFSCLVSCQTYEEVLYQSTVEEVKEMTHNIYHLDGPGALRHLDLILEIKEIQAVQWVQGVGDDAPIMQWLEVIKKIQASRKGVVVNLQVDEIEPFMAEVKPEGIYLCVQPRDLAEARAVERMASKWTTHYCAL